MDSLRLISSFEDIQYKKLYFLSSPDDSLYMYINEIKTLEPYSKTNIEDYISLCKPDDPNDECEMKMNKGILSYFEKDEKDTRVKHLFLNDKGKKIFKEIFDSQKKRIYNALLDSSSEEVVSFDNVLRKIING